MTDPDSGPVLSSPQATSNVAVAAVTRTAVHERRLTLIPWREGINDRRLPRDSLGRAIERTSGVVFTAPLNHRLVVRRRLATQRLVSAPLPTAVEAVRLLTCVQSQERDHAFFSLGLRTREATYASVRAEFDKLAFVRTHILRPTWHLVAAEDLRWILALTSPRVVSGMTARHRELGLDDRRLVSRAQAALRNLLGGHNYLTRVEIGERFQGRPGLPQPGPQLGHLLMLSELDGTICSGPITGVHHSYALTDEVVAATPPVDEEEATARLAHRFFSGHGPASVKDFTRWSSLTGAATRAALAGLGGALEQVEVDGERHWFDPSSVVRRRRGAPAAFLFPTYDEAVLTYRAVSFLSVDDHPMADRVDPFWAQVVVGERSVGLWKRTVKGSRVSVDVSLAPSVGRDHRQAVATAARRLATFLERDLDLVGDPLA